MAFDGITVAAVAAELKKDLLNSRIYKICRTNLDSSCTCKHEFDSISPVHNTP